MTSIQERLQLKRAPLDTWNIREQLCLASAVVRSGDQNWMSVSRALKSLADPNRPHDWYSQKNCAVQYGALLEHVETPKRKKRNSEGGVETPQESILKRLRDQRVLEIKNSLAEINAEYEQIKNEVNEVRNSSTSEEKLQELWAEIEASKQKRERENATRAAWMKEREERIIKAEKTWRPQTTVATTTQVTSSTPSSPLLSSLLKSTPVVTTPQHILHPNNCIETVSPSAGAPTLSLLLEQPQDKEHAAIEHIKSQLVQIEHQLKASTSGSPVPNPPSIVTTAATPAVDIDDIEIKAEDVYAFSDIDIHIPPVAAMHKPRVEKQYKKEEEPCVIDEPMQENKVEEVPVPEPIVEPSNTTEDAQVELIKTEVIQEEETIPETEIVPDVKIAFPEVKFPTPEIKVIRSDDTQLQPKVEQEPLEASLSLEQEVKQEKTEIEDPVEEPIVEEIQDVPEKEVIEEKVDEPEPAPLKVDTPQEDAQPEPEVAEVETNIPTEEIPLPESPKPEEPAIEETAPEAQPKPEADTEVNVQIQDIPLPETEETKEEMEEVRETKEEKKEEDEDSIPLKDMIKEEIVQEKDKEEEPHTETDDDTPMELSREEDKEGKTKRDYSRKKKPDSRTCSGSESAPDSPSSSEAERQHRLWKKSVMLVYSRLCAHKYASLFLRPITDEEAPGYSTIVKRPMDLSTIRRNIDAGHIRTTAQFQRDVLLMLSNALMYNSTSHSVYAMAKDMFEEAQCQLGMLLAAQAHAGLVNTAPPTRKRRPQTNPNSPSQFKTQRL